jgi:acetyltransferase-like isoleucine patch superfamily enzyme
VNAPLTVPFCEAGKKAGNESLTERKRMSRIKAWSNRVGRLVRKLRIYSSGELERIRYYPGVVHGADIRITGLVNFGSEPFLIRLGSHITISDNVRFVTHDGGARIFRDEIPNLHVYGPIDVGDYSFIGMNTLILPGVRIGSRSVVGAGSVVTRDVPDGEVWAGIPARFVKSASDYREGLMAKAFPWTVGDYGDDWRRSLEARFPRREG